MCSEVLCETLRKPSRSASQIKDSRDFQSNHVRSNDLHPLREKRRAVISCTVVIFRNAGFVVIHLFLACCRSAAYNEQLHLVYFSPSGKTESRRDAGAESVSSVTQVSHYYYS